MQGKISPAYDGFVWVDVKDNTVLEFTMNAQDLPGTFRLQKQTRAWITTPSTSKACAVLPSKAVMHFRSGKNDQKNEITFHNYHEYTADTTLKFNDIVPDTPEPPIEVVTLPSRARDIF